ncbi:MAG: GTP-binding protein HSR1 [Wenzhouxiangellaceae bacterium]|nr:MAG: GTP-binding protein HSR1 [Wenzhouxiangellaceae bacterium]
MKLFLDRLGRMRLIGTALTVLPLLALPLFGLVWLWQSGHFLFWILAAGTAALLGLGLIQVARWRQPRRPVPPGTGPAQHWSRDAEDCFAVIEQMADDLNPEDYSLGESEGLLSLAREVLQTVARHFHPDSKTPLLEVTLPHTLAVIERTAAELRHEISEQIPFSHQVRLGTLVRARGWHDWYKRNEAWYRAGRLLVNPQSALVAELRRLAGQQAFNQGAREVQAWMLREYMRKLGYQAIELYGGFATLEQANPALPSADGEAVEPHLDEEQSLRLLVLGRTNAGKSSLINALFGQALARADVLPDTTEGLDSYRLVDDEGLDALIIDSPGFDGQTASAQATKKALLEADLVFWVSAAHRADRASERTALDQLRQTLAAGDRRMPPLLVALSHIDLLSPRREWRPPYQLRPPAGAKAEQIADAVEAAAIDLGVEPGQVVPVCLHKERRYNVDDALWAAMMVTLPEANRVRLLRCLRLQKRDENWALLLTQLKNSGRLLGKFRPGAARL